MKKDNGFLLWTGCRYFFYAVLLAVLTQVIILQAGPEHGDTLFAEGSLTEWLQVVAIVLILGFAACIGFIDKSLRTLVMGFSGCGLMILIREFDRGLENNFFDGAWQVGAGLVIIITIVLLVRGRSALMSPLKELMGQAAFGFMAAGGLLVAVFSRLYGQKVFWKEVMGEKFMYSVKAAAEENSELIGYFLILVGVLEWLHYTRSKLKAETTRD